MNKNDFLVHFVNEQGTEYHDRIYRNIVYEIYNLFVMNKDIIHYQKFFDKYIHNRYSFEDKPLYFIQDKNCNCNPKNCQCYR